MAYFRIRDCQILFWHGAGDYFFRLMNEDIDGVVEISVALQPPAGAAQIGNGCIVFACILPILWHYVRDAVLPNER